MNTTAQATDSIVSNAYFPALRDYIISATGLEYFSNRPQVLAGHLAERIQRRGVSGCCDYLKLLEEGGAGEAELDELIALLTIGETYFFRHRELFDALRDVGLPAIIERNQSTKRLRIWSAGCSTGPEAYSVSVLLRRELGSAVRDWNVSIVGTDINRPFLSQAAEGRYEDWAFRGTPPEFRRECFVEDRKSWSIAPQFRDGVTFQYHNLARHPFPSLVHNLVAFDLIVCRNVLIYFAPEIATGITERLAECLVPGGWLAVGHAEHGAHLQTAFEAVECRGATLYRKSAPVEKVTAAVPPMMGRRLVESPKRFSVVEKPGDPALTQAVGKFGPHNPSRAGPAPAAAELTGASGISSGEITQIRSLADQGELAAALNQCEAMIAENRLDPVGHYYQAVLLEQTGAHDAALAALGRAIYLKRDFHLAHYYLGLTQKKLGQATQSARSFRNVLSILSRMDRATRLPDADGMTIADLEELARIHLESLEAA
jgi:chemotaxis protein methyltransferase CheR